jgi:hypothetical protein
MTITRTLNFRGSRGKANLPVTFDDSLSYSRIDSTVARALAVVTKLPEPILLEPSSEVVEQVVLLDFYLNGLRFSDEFLVTPKASGEATIGALTMRKWKIKVDMGKDEIVTDPRSARRILR